MSFTHCHDRDWPDAGEGMCCIGATGASVPGSPVNYCPPSVDDVPYRADGSPAFICAGWAARR